MGTGTELTSDEDVVLTVQGVSKKFCRSLKRSLFYGIQDIGSELLGLRESTGKLRPEEFWALHDVSFTLRRQDALGLVGKNGSGKTTLLRIISGLIRPDMGSITIKGQVAPLIALGAGFNPVLTGRENIYANMSILGLSNAEIDARFQDVVAFADIDDAIDSPVHSYSSGMAARLGFSCAIHTQPDVLLIDEVLSVGDSLFRAKCLRKLHELRQNGTAFIIVSHNPHLILSICESAVYLNHGKLLASGETPNVISQYEKDLLLGGGQQVSGSIQLPEKSTHINSGLISSGFTIRSIFFRNGQGDVVQSPISGEPIYFCVGCQLEKGFDKVSMSLVFKGLAEGGEIVLLLNSLSDHVWLELPSGNHEIQVQTPYLGLRLGTYVMDVFLKHDRIYDLDCYEGFQFTVDAKESLSRGLFYQPRTWTVVYENSS
jgi:lipopolysaccharide transport system ATP-binding protein